MNRAPTLLYGLAAALALAAAGLQAAGPAGTGLMAALAAGLLACAASALIDWARGVLWTAALLLGCNAYLLARKLDTSGAPSLCNVNDVINCDLINTSEASEIAGIPVTLPGAAFYLGLMLAAAVFRRPEQRLAEATLLFMVPALAFSGYLAWEAYLLRAVCVLCLTIYAGNILLAFAGWRGLQGDAPLLERVGPALTSPSVLTITGLFGAGVLLGPRPAADRSSDSLASLYQDPGGPVTLDGTEPVLGKADAPYLVVEWADFGCPHCARASAELKDLVKRRPEVQVRFRVFPLSGLCNPALESQGGGERCAAALAAECAGEQGLFWPYASLIFQNQQSLDEETLTRLATTAGLDTDRWMTCLQGSAAMEGVIADAQAGAKTGLMGTPALFLKGTHADAWLDVRDVESIERLIDAHQQGVPLPKPTR